MNRPRVIVIILAAVLLAGVVVYLCIPKEPRYQGRKLSEWIDVGQNYDRSSPQWQEASRAVQQIGQDAVPFLLKWSSARDSKAKAGIVNWLNSYLPPHNRIRPAADRHAAAYIGFRMLGKKASTVWPVLVQWTNDSDLDRRKTGLRTLVCSKADKATIIPVFERLLNDPDSKLRKEAAGDFCMYYRREAEAAGVLKQYPELGIQLFSRPLPRVRPVLRGDLTPDQ